MATQEQLKTMHQIIENIDYERLAKEIQEDIWAGRIQLPTSGCNACRFSDAYNWDICTLPDISVKDFQIGIMGENCSRFEPNEHLLLLRKRIAEKNSVAASS